MNGEILVVDDRVENLEVASQVLEDAGYEVAVALDGDRALKLANKRPLDLILLDVQMPGIDGFQTCEKLKANPETAAIPVIFMTALGDTDSKVTAFDLGAIDYITKPFQEKELLARVRTHLQLRQWSKTLETCVAQRTHELQAALDRFHQSQLKLVQSEKMSALGNLVAGVAHEINNPVGFIWGNLHETQQSLEDVIEHLNLYRSSTSPTSEIEEHEEEIDLDYLLDDLPKMIEAMKLGCDRIKNISTSLRTFSRADQEYKTAFNLHEGLESTLLILKHRLKANDERPEIIVDKNYGKLPVVKCFPGQLNQVFMNILANAIDALDESNQAQSFQQIEAHPNCIKITTALVDQHRVQIRIADNGLGMPEAVKQHIFDRLYTTKKVGKGTGLGLAIARQIVVEKHGGLLTVYSTPNQGSEFIIEIPVEASSSQL